MRIGFDAKRYYHNHTGLGNYARALVRDMVTHHTEHEFFLFAQKADKEPDLAYSLVKGNSPFWRQVGISTAIRKQKLDIYHGLSAELPLSKPKNTKYVVTIHDLIFQKYPAYYKSADRLIYALKMDNALKQADHVVVASEQTKQDLLRSFPNYQTPISVIYQDCAPVFYQRLSATELQDTRTKHKLPESFMVMVSTFEERKNHINLLKAYLSSAIQTPLVLVGRPGNTLNQVKDYIKLHQLEERVHVLLDVAQAELSALYQMAKWSIFPSVYEGFGIPVVESLASGTPVLTSQDTSMSEIVGKAGLVFDPLDPSTISQALLQVQNGDVYQGLLEAQATTLSRFSQSTITNQYINLYTSLHA